ncbi:uncharacterized protein K452DRAFT_289831 [Aplosporella prunicola CBS 121167]|uniref:Membrane anchor Opy2 N-terminal domain-containing protein n=1 Tax=Aplosporella prunicola CBS 121167 TaxID=1176127 RepID=A0A6A6B556_9PEZI|nr:uncharacterized protein K452DRAFT_289831 [Aplosporella prunicola CBS 121167]KAF2139282.1 hypothetical protein K452DRAFT_289831 [Aplosporella prunicola CBS 121167]
MPLSNQAVEHTLRTIFRRCVQCPNETPSCPSCDDGEYCSQVLPSCTQCASAVCVKMDGSPGKSSSSDDGPNVGAIAGGVVGGVAVICIITFLIWWFYVRRRREDDNERLPDIDVQQEKQNDFTMRRDARASTHTVASMASTVLTRASNIIQIAYIPGVTNRSGAPSPGMLAPPVPPIPSVHQPGSPYSTEEQHFFVPGDLRDSTYSGLGDNHSFGRSSISPSLARSSVATTIYRNNAVISPLPAQTIVRGKAAVVSVKSGSSGSPAETPSSETPPVPAINYDRLDRDGSVKSPFRVQMPSSSDGGSLKPGMSPQGSIRSVQTVGKAKPLNIVKKNSTKGKSTATSSLANSVSAAASEEGSPKSSPKSTKSRESADRIPITLRPLTEISATDSADEAPKTVGPISLNMSHMDDPSNDEEPAQQRKSLKRTSGRDSQVTEIQDTPGVIQSPFGDKNAENLPAAIENATKQASKPAEGGLGIPREGSPFGDEHALKN